MNTKQTVLGLLIIAAGIIALLANTNVASMRDIVADWWPLAFIVIGLYMLWSNARNFIWALAVIVAGGLLLVNTLGIADISFGQVVVPLALVAAGLSVVVGARPRSSSVDLVNEDNVTAILGGVTSKNTDADYRGGYVNTIMGGAELDLSKATIKKEATLRVWILMGGLDLRVPENVIVKPRVASLMSSVEDNSQPTSSKNAPILYIDGNVVMGGIEVKR